LQDETSHETRVSHGLVGKVCGGRWNLESFGREARSVPYILCMYRASLVSNVSQDRACKTRPQSCGLVSRLVLQGLAARHNSTLLRVFHVSFGLVIIVAIAVCKSTFLVLLIFLGSLLSILFNFLALYLFEEVMQLCSNR